MLHSSAHIARKALYKIEKAVIARRFGEMEAEAEYDLSDERKKELYQNAQEIKCQLMKLEYQNVVYALELLEVELTNKLEKLRTLQEEESIAARVVRRHRLLARR